MIAELMRGIPFCTTFLLFFGDYFKCSIMATHCLKMDITSHYWSLFPYDRSDSNTGPSLNSHYVLSSLFVWLPLKFPA